MPKQLTSVSAGRGPAAALIFVMGLVLACDEDPELDPLAQSVRADVEACGEELDAYAQCGPTPECGPNPNATSFSMAVLLNCAASVCAESLAADPDQCRYDVMLEPGPLCAEARELCRSGDRPETWSMPE